MPAEPQLDVLPYNRRRIMFWFLAVFFIVVLPVVILYASGYRLVQTENGERVIMTTGGMYVAVFTEDIDLYIDDEVPQDRRPFSSAFYVQGFDPGMFEIRTQGEGLETWVKDLPVYSQIVTQAFAFNMPRTPVVRFITRFNDDAGNAVIGITVATSSTPLSFATTTNTVVRTQLTTATSTLLQNPEYTLFETLFASTTEERELLEQIQKLQATEPESFAFVSEVVATPTVPTTTATTTAFSGDMRLIKQGDDVYARWFGDADSIPHYFCIDYKSEASTTLQYGQHIYEDLVREYASSTGELSEEYVGQKLCRSSIRIDRKWQFVQWFGFMPGANDLVIMQLQDGVYVVEIDDRAWQNVQLLYPGDYLEVLIDSGRIMIKDDDYFVEVFAQIPQ